MIIVTGGAGFIGSHLVKELEKRGTPDVVVCDFFGTDDKWKNIAKRRLENILPPGDLSEFLNDNAADIESVFHMGAVSATTERDVDLIIRSNIRLSIDLWNWCTANNSNLIYASSAATFGDGKMGFDDDNTPNALARLRPLNAYGWSKHVFDQRVARIVSENGPRPPHWAGLKFFNVYGPNEYHKDNMISVVLKNFRQINETGKAVLFRSHNPDYPDGGQKRDFVWVEDCVDIALWVSEASSAPGIFNVGTGKSRTFYDLASSVFGAMGKVENIEFIDTPAAIRDRYQYFTQANMTRLRDAGYDRPGTSLEDGVLQYIRDYLLAEDPYA
ncbi:MAG: ADP-L-glycero-D-manno-heptose-6-epimerase [Alphaproteobacteria bacterium MarineAlpha11_Bin1]|nr:MAG: ADP-L-glycero-D-manno-heptose-6-epimerase [Alphaproteobacteria bacterium MarineAlpha11_Bin1]